MEQGGEQALHCLCWGEKLSLSVASPSLQDSAKFGVIDVLRMDISDGCHLCPVLIFYLLSWEQVAGYNSKDAHMSFTELQP